MPVQLLLYTRATLFNHAGPAAAAALPVVRCAHDCEATHPLTPVQARNNARIVVTGSVDLFSDALAGAEVLLGPTKTRWVSSVSDDSHTRCTQ